MYFYAQLNDENICIGVSQLRDEENSPDLIPITGSEFADADLLNRIYENDSWGEKVALTPKEPEGDVQ